MPESVPEVVARMEAILAPLPRSDGVAAFTRLYLDVTRAVAADLEGAVFADPRFLERLDVLFARLYFGALDAYARDPASTTRAWVPLFAGRRRPGVTPLQFALAGMNAHINRDLPVALVETCTELDADLQAGSPQHADFLAVNDILARVEERVRGEYLGGWLNALDRLLRRVRRIDEIAGAFDVARARDAAWTNAEALWALRDRPELATEYLLALDRMVGMAGRGLLVPADTVLQKVARAFARLRGRLT